MGNYSDPDLCRKILVLADMEDRRAVLTEQLADYVLENGLANSSLRALAGAADTSDRMLLYYFPDKEAIVAEVLACLGDRLMAVLQAHMAPEPMPYAEIEPRMLAVLGSDELFPYLRLFLEIASGAACGDAFFREVGGALVNGFHQWVMEQIAGETDGERARDAVRLLAMADGMAVLKSVNFPEARLIA